MNPLDHPFLTSLAMLAMIPGIHYLAKWRAGGDRLDMLERKFGYAMILAVVFLIGAVWEHASVVGVAYAGIMFMLLVYMLNVSQTIHIAQMSPEEREAYLAEWEIKSIESRRRGM